MPTTRQTTRMDGLPDDSSVDDTDDLYITPNGSIVWDASSFGKCFSHGTGSGLLAMATAEWPADSGATAFYLRNMVRNALTRFAHACSENDADDTNCLQTIIPSPQEVSTLLDQIPPVKGGEYLTTAIIRSWHEQFAHHIRKEADARNISLSEWLRSLGEPWSRIGRVFFHLAENKDDQSGTRPFAFLATFAHKTSGNGELAHLPLGKALQLYHDDHKALLTLLQPLKEASHSSPLIKRFLESRQIYSPMAWDAATTQAFLRDTHSIEESGIIVRMVNLWKKPPAKLQLTVTAEQTEPQDTQHKAFSVHSLLSFSVAVSLGGRNLTQEELEALIASGAGLIRFKGEWIDAEPEKIKQLLDRWQHAVSMMNRTGIPLIQGLKLLINGTNSQLPSLPPKDQDCRLVMGEKLEHALTSIKQRGDLSDLQIPPPLLNILRPYQQNGIRFLEQTTSPGFGACLADDMGLGKTLQCLTWLNSLKKRNKLAPYPALVVVPASLLGNWLDEIRRFTPELKAGLLHPSELSPQLWRSIRHYPEHWFQKHDIILTSYGMVTRLEWLNKTEFSVLILDEAQAIKNPSSQRSNAIRKLQAKRKVALSGTPVENSLMELWSLMNIINPGLLGSQQEFRQMTNEMGADFSPLRKLTHPFILRRMKTDPNLVPDLPDKTDMNAYCALTPQQAVLYKSQVDALHAVLSEPDPNQRLMLILPFLAKFKQICNHPVQFLGVGDYAPEESGKFIRLKSLAEQIADRQEKLIIFTQFRSMMDPLHNLLSSIYKRSGLILHGETPIRERQQLVNAFQKENGPPFFVLSLKAAGTGLTLTQANHVIHFDRWWNPAVENQATDRTYRIGQHRNVLVHRLICKGTIEDKIDLMLKQKQQLSDSIFESGIEKLLMHMTSDEILDLIA